MKRQLLMLVWLSTLIVTTAVYSYAACDDGSGRWYRINTICVYNGCGPGDDCRGDFCESNHCDDFILFCIASWACYDPFWSGCWNYACGWA